MKTATALNIGCKSHPGLHRTVNEDRILIDETHGIFLIVDGLGGHAAGETAAEVALQTIRECLTHSDGTRDLEEQIRAAITEANNRIFELAQSHESWAGMACVLTLAVLRDDCVTVGHVGDSRLYLIRNGTLQKVTSDHSPVGEMEESGELSEKEAMQHPRRHEVFRDVGSERRQLDDLEFIQTKQILLPPDAALLLCTDGLTDALTAAEIQQIISTYNGNSEAIAEKLIEAANSAGGKDNVSVVFVAGPEFSADEQLTTSAPVADRHTITRVRNEQSRWGQALQKLPWLLTGMILGILIWATAERLVPRAATSVRNPAGGRSPMHIAVNPSDARSIIDTLASALPGDIIDIPQGDYLGPLMLKDGVTLIGPLSHRAIVRSDPASSTNLGVAVIASGVDNARIENLEIVGDATHPLQIGISVNNSMATIVNSKISGAIEAGVYINGKSEAVLLADVLSGNSGAGITAKDQSTVRLSGNWVTDNGKVPGALRAGLEMTPTVNLEAANNLFSNNGVAFPLTARK